MSEPQPGMVQERDGEGGLATDARKAAAQRSSEGGEIRRAHIGQVPRFHVARDLLDRIELGGIGGQPLDREPPSLLMP